MTLYVVSPDEHSMPADHGSWVQFQLRSSVEGSGQWDDATPQYWTIDDESVASIDQTSGVATAVGPGTANVTAMVDADTNEVAFATLTVTGGGSAVTMYVVSPDEHSMPADHGSWVQFQLRSSVEGSGQWDDATPQYWTIDDQSVATIDQTTGVATAVGPGTANVTAMVDADTNEVAFATLTVTGSSAPSLTYYVISPEYPSLGIGEWIQLQLRSSVEGSNTWDDASAQYWTIDDPSVATIDQDTGAVTAVGEGTANVTAVIDADTNQVAFVQVTVTGAV